MLSQTDIFKSRGYNVPSYVYDAEGKKVEIETREDEDQTLKYDKIVKSLVNAGYFRARIKGITPFDVVVGGITWCIDSSDIDLDVDLLFEEGLTTGQKISLTEKIVVVLPKIKCPFFIEPHQIQGLDFIHIYPVIEWLIKWSTENRKKKARYLQAYARNEYHKHFLTSSGKRFVNMRKNIEHVVDQYQPRRLFQQKNVFSDIKLRVENTLAEYGLSELKEIKDSVLCKGPGYEIQLKQNEVASLLSGLADGSKEKLNFENPERILNSDFRLQESERKIKSLKEDLERLQKRKYLAQTELRIVRQEADKLAAEGKETVIELEKFAKEEQIVILQLQTMLQEHDKLKEEERKYKEFCKIEMEALDNVIEELESSQIDEEISELKDQCEHLQTQLEEKKQELGKITRTIISKERSMEQIPSRAELSQYQKRFLELYDQMALKHTETKRYVIMYNTLNDKYVFMEKEFNIMNSIYDAYAQVVTSGGNKEEFLKQLKTIAAGVEESKEKTIIKRNDSRKMKEGLSSHIEHLQKLKSQYAVAVKEVAEMHKRIEKLTDLKYKLHCEAGELNSMEKKQFEGARPE